MQNTAVNAPITFEEIVMVMINDKMTLLLGSNFLMFREQALKSKPITVCTLLKGHPPE